jgi:hypothetical protein
VASIRATFDAFEFAVFRQMENENAARAALLRAGAGKIRRDADVPGEVEQVRRETVVLRDRD